MVSVSGKNVFLSGPMTGIEHYNVGAFAEAHATLKELGARMVWSPAMRYLKLGNDKLAAMRHEDYMADCISELTRREKRSQGWETVIPLRYDLLVQLEGWQLSQGAMLERMVAEACGIEVCEIGDVS